MGVAQVLTGVNGRAGSRPWPALAEVLQPQSSLVRGIRAAPFAMVLTPRI